MAIAVSTVESIPQTEFAPGTFPLNFEVRNEKPSRLLTLLRLPLLVPWYILNFGVMLVVFAAVVVAWLAVVITGHHPKPLWRLIVAGMHWNANYFAFYHMLSDRYALFEFGPKVDSPVHFNVEFPASSSRLIAIFRGFLMIPGYIVCLAITFTAVLLLPVFWVAILVTGSRPQWLFNFMEGTGRWYLRFFAYFFLLRDEYPPYSMDRNAQVSSNLTAFIVGITFIGAVMAMFSQFDTSRRAKDDDDWWPSSNNDEDQDLDCCGRESASVNHETWCPQSA